VKQLHARGKNLCSTGTEIASGVVTSALSVITEQTKMSGFSAFSAVLVRTTANVVSGGVVFVILVIRFSLRYVRGACSSCLYTGFNIFISQNV
jgi:hypothetical protein